MLFSGPKWTSNAASANDRFGPMTAIKPEISQMRTRTAAFRQKRSFDQICQVSPD